MPNVTPRFGWAGPYNAAREMQRIGHLFSRFFISAASPQDNAGKRVVLWDATKQLHGDYHPNIPQEIGDCVSFGCASAVDHLSDWEIARLNQPEKWRKAFQPYIYGISRIQIGGGRIGNSDGSLGSWAAEGIKQYGILFADEQGVPTYAGSVAKKWGAKPGPASNFIELAKPRLIRSAAPIKSYPEARDALCNGYSLTYASDVGHAMLGKYDAATKKHWHTGRDTWPHQRCILGVDDDPKRPGVFILNSWGPDAHGPQEDGPPGGMWWDAADFDKDVRRSGTECFALSMFEGFPGEANKPNFLLV